MKEEKSELVGNRRDFMEKCGRFAVVTPPALTLLLSTSMNSSAVAASVKGNNGVGNGIDPPPPGDPKVNDGTGSGPGNPGNKG